LLYGLGIQTVYVVLPLAFVLAMGAVVVFNKVDARRKGLPEVMPSAEAIESGSIDAKAVENGNTDENNGSHDYFSLVPITAALIVAGYFTLLFIFVTFST
jgi:hypothetical protein